jgi:hypothetical protein
MEGRRGGEAQGVADPKKHNLGAFFTNSSGNPDYNQDCQIFLTKMGKYIKVANKYTKWL